MSELVLKFLQAQNYAATTRRAKGDWLIAWERFIGKPLEEATTEDILKLKSAFANHKGRVPLKYAQALRGFFRWVSVVQPDFRDPTTGIEFSQGEDPAFKDALPKDVMLRILDYARQDAKVSPYREGPDVVVEGDIHYDLHRFLWFEALRLGPAFLFRVHELLPRKACHKVTIVDPANYRIKCLKPGCKFEGSYWPDKILAADPKHVPNEKLADFRFGAATDKSGKEWTTIVFMRKGRVRRNRNTGEIKSEVHWSAPHPLSPGDIHSLRKILLSPPKTCKTADDALSEYGELFEVGLRNSNGEAVKLGWHIWSKHSAVTNRKLDDDTSDQISRDADVSVTSLRPYDHAAQSREDLSRQSGNPKRFWTA